MPSFQRMKKNSRYRGWCFTATHFCPPGPTSILGARRYASDEATRAAGAAATGDPTPVAPSPPASASVAFSWVFEGVGDTLATEAEGMSNAEGSCHLSNNPRAPVPSFSCSNRPGSLSASSELPPAARQSTVTEGGIEVERRPARLMPTFRSLLHPPTLTPLSSSSLQDLGGVYNMSLSSSSPSSSPSPSLSSPLFFVGVTRFLLAGLAVLERCEGAECELSDLRWFLPLAMLLLGLSAVEWSDEPASLMEDWRRYRSSSLRFRSRVPGTATAVFPP